MQEQVGYLKGSSGVNTCPFRILNLTKMHVILSFYGTSENAVKTQIWIAISVYVLVATIKKRLNLNLSLYAILQILSVSPFRKNPILQALTPTDYNDNRMIFADS